ncbi:MAG: LicD family protein [Lachnospiraceae bacterium]|nr:LicD family protein [Lachnospiraceae bacterium]
MLNFADEFFRPEVRENFQIDTTMKTVWAAQLEVLSEINKVCERHGLTWYMAFGSLLGAVRHRGFIPWDDDIDICLKREDYMQLLYYLSEELPKGYVVRSPLLDSWYPEYHSCVVNSDSISIEPEHLKQFHGCPFVVGIDVFPLDLLEEGEENSLRINLFKAARQAALMIKSEEINEELNDILDILEKQCDVTIDRSGLSKDCSEDVRNEWTAGLWGLANEIVMSSSGKKTADLAMYLDYLKFGKYYQASWFDTVEWMPFEGVMVPVPGGYDKILRATYGDYSVCIRNTALHGYPFYNKQLEQLRKRVAEIEGVRKRED